MQDFGRTSITINSPPSIHRCEPNWSWRPPPLPDFDLWCVLSGKGRLKLGSYTYSLSPGFCVLFRPGEAPSAVHDPSNRLVVFASHFSGHIPDTVPSSPVRIGDVGIVESTARLVVQAGRNADGYGKLRAEMGICQLLVLLAEAGGTGRKKVIQHDDRIQRVAAAIEEDPASGWTVHRIAGMAHLSPSQVTRRFERATGFSPGKFVLYAKINRARALLVESGQTVGEIAGGLGYDDVSYFCRQFRTVTGVTALQYRRGAR